MIYSERRRVEEEEERRVQPVIQRRTNDQVKEGEETTNPNPKTKGALL